MANDSVAKVELIYRMEWDRTYSQGVERVWAAISDEKEISEWMKYPTRLEQRVGGIIHIDFSSQGSLEGTVCNFDRPTSLVYTWGDSLVRWDLDGNREGVTLHFAHIGVRPELAVGLGAGWHAFLDQLEGHLSGNPRPNRYKELKNFYEQEIKPQSTDRPAVL